MKNTKFYSKGKFLLTGEYVIIDGAFSLAVPLNFGQFLTVEEQEKNEISFETYQNSNLIYSNNFIYYENEYKVNNSISQNASDKFILQIINTLIAEKPSLFSKGLKFTSDLNFDINWGLGSSSSLISNFSQWSEIEKFELFKKLSNGSGYDVFAAQAETAITYQLINDLPIVQEVELNNDILENCFFVYLGKKQNSENEVKNYRKSAKISSTDIQNIYNLTQRLIDLNSYDELIEIIQNHEKIISSILNRPTIKEELFADFDGEIKSLGAWGGDFVLAFSKNGNNYTKNYFHSKNLNTIFTWNQMVFC